MKRFLLETYTIKYLGPLGFFIDIEIDCQIEEKTFSSSQKIYVPNTLEYSRISDCKPVNSPILVNIDFIKNFNKSIINGFNEIYQSHVEIHIEFYICSRPNLKYGVSTLSKFLFNSILVHIGSCQTIILIFASYKKFQNYTLRQIDETTTPQNVHWSELSWRQKDSKIHLKLYCYFYKVLCFFIAKKSNHCRSVSHRRWVYCNLKGFKRLDRDRLSLWKLFQHDISSSPSYCIN